jgi:hypothetical protein
MTSTRQKPAIPRASRSQRKINNGLNSRPLALLRL